MKNLEYFININPVIVKYNDLYYFVISSLLGYNNNPRYSLFVLINDKVIDEEGEGYIGAFLRDLTKATDMYSVSEVLGTGVPGKFIVGEDYFLSHTLWDDLMTYNSPYLNTLDANTQYYMPDYLDTEYNRINQSSYSYI